MNQNTKIENLRMNIEQLSEMIANAQEPALSLLIANRETLEAELAKLSPVKTLAGEIEEAVFAKAKALTDVPMSTSFEDLHPSVAMRALHGAARAVIGHLLYLDAAHRGIMARQAMSATTAGWRRPLDSESTAPVDNTEAQLESMSEQTESCLQTLAEMLSTHQKCEREAIKRGIAVSDFERFPTVAEIQRGREESMNANAAKRRAQANAIRTVAPSIVSLVR